MQEAGAELVEDIMPEALWELGEGFAAGNTMGVEFPHLLQRYFAQYAPNGTVRSMQDIVDWYQQNPEISNWAWEYDAFSYALYPDEEWGPQHLEWIETLHDAARTRGIDAIVAEHNVDALVAPTCAIPTHWTNASYFWSSSQLAASAGYPSVTIPIGYTENLPAGLHFFGSAFSERRLIRYAAVLERILNARVAPEFLESTRYDELYAPQY